uniref:Uncharacterized protein n=1 Tax=Strigamia maritima TaxID=126957 RepID=T1JCI0_STRMM
MENRKALLPLCSGVLGVISLALQVTAVATPHWSDFYSDDPMGNGHFPYGVGNYGEKGYYGLWSICLTIYEGMTLPRPKCDAMKPKFDPGMTRYYAGAFAIADIILLLVFLFPVPAQLMYLYKNKGIVSISYRALALIKVISIVFGAASGMTAAVLIGIHTKPYYELPKGWSFGLQVVVVILQIFLFICALMEYYIGKKFPNVPLNKINKTNGYSSGLHNPGFHMTSASTESVDKQPESRIFPISVSSESGKPQSNGPQSKPYTLPKYEYGNTLPVANDNLSEPGNRKSMQYLEDVDIQKLEPKPKPKPPKPRKTAYRNSAYKPSHNDESDLDCSVPSLSSRNGRNHSTSMSSDTPTSYSKSTDV